VPVPVIEAMPLNAGIEAVPMGRISPLAEVPSREAGAKEASSKPPAARVCGVAGGSIEVLAVALADCVCA
jgi:hypothetical protein